jgi:hypothetical protein
VCRSKPRGKGSGRNDEPTHVLKEEEQEQQEEVYTMFQLGSKRVDPLYTTLLINNKPLRMEVDTGASLSVVSEGTYRQLWEKEEAPRLQPSKAKLRTYTGEEIMVKGTILVEVEHDGEQKQLSLTVTEGEGPTLLGRDWLARLRVDWQSMFNTKEVISLETILEKHKALFQDELGTVRGTKAKLHIDPTVTPRFFKPRPVPFSLRKKVDDELERLEEAGIIRRKDFSEWAAPIVPVLKSDGSVRICGDYKVTANRAVKLDAHPIPRIEELFATMSGGKYFTKLDLSHAYLQVELEEESKPLLTINTHKGLYENNRLPYGVSSAFRESWTGLWQ